MTQFGSRGILISCSRAPSDGNITVSKFYLRKPTFRNPPMRRLQKLALNQSEIGVNNMYISVFREYINPTV